MSFKEEANDHGKNFEKAAKYNQLFFSFCKIFAKKKNNATPFHLLSLVSKKSGTIGIE